MKRLCRNGAHTIQRRLIFGGHFWEFTCQDCPLAFAQTQNDRLGYRGSRGPDINALIRTAERDWYIQELES